MNQSSANPSERLRVFCASLADVFDYQGPVQWRAKFPHAHAEGVRLTHQRLSYEVELVGKPVLTMRRRNSEPAQILIHASSGVIRGIPAHEVLPNISATTPN
jgi:hypothetical protein